MSDLALKKDEESGLVLADYGDTGVDGFEGQTEDDRSKVWLKLLQGTSPQCKGKNKIAEARPGMFYHTGTGRLFDGEKGVEIIILLTRSCYVEWKPKGGGYVGEHEKGSDVYEKARAFSDERGIFPLQIPTETEDGVVAGNVLKDTRYVYILSPGRTDESPWEFASLAIDSTKLKPYKRMMDRLWRFRVLNAQGKEVRPPMFAVKLRLVSFDDEANGQEFSGLRFEAANDDDLSQSLLTPDSELFKAASKIALALNTGDIEVDHSSIDEGRADNDEVIDNEAF